ncbi:hypothetical protein HK102_006690 [Quaeritorhiza haematococci]|nr:hypothetical protein HK102_006690 [Quaeritorhiza haematococci]
MSGGRMLAATIVGVGVVGFGYAVMKMTTPSDAEMRQRMQDRIKAKDMTMESNRNKKIMEEIFANAKSDRPVWDVRWNNNSEQAKENTKS